jgi:transposase
MLFEFDQKKTEMETYQKITSVYHKDTISHITVYRWYAKFCSDDRNLVNKPLPGATSSVDNNKLQKLIEEYPRFTLGDLATISNVSKATVL